MKLHAVQTLLGLSIMLIAAGLVWTLVTLDQMTEISRRIKNRRDVWVGLQLLKKERTAELAAVRLYEQLPARTPVALSNVVAACGSSGSADILERESKPIAAGWTARRVEVLFKDVSLESVARFLAEAENQRPPWRLMECTITASGPEGQGRAALIMEALEKKTP